MRNSISEDIEIKSVLSFKNTKTYNFHTTSNKTVTSRYASLSEVTSGFLSILDNRNQALYMNLTFCFISTVTKSIKVIIGKDKHSLSTFKHALNY